MSYLKRDPDLVQSVFQGFTVKPASLDLPLVRRRLDDLLKHDSAILQDLADLWRSGAKELCEEVAALSVPRIRASVPALTHTHGVSALRLALVMDGRRSLQPLAERLKEEAAELPPETFERPEADRELEALKAAERHLQQKCETLQSELNGALTLAAQAQAEASSLGTERDGLKDRLAARDKEVADLRRRVARLENTAERTERKLKAAQQEAAALQRRCKQLEAEVECLRAGPPKPVQVVTGASSAGSEKEGVLATALRAKPARDTEAVVDLTHDGTQWNLKVKDFICAVDRNDVELVGRVNQALMVLRQRAPHLFRRVVAAFRKVDSYYAEVAVRMEELEGAIVDGSNVAHYEKDRSGRAQLGALLSVREELRRRRFFPLHIVVDAALPHQVDDPAGLEALLRRGEVTKVLSGTSADDEIVREARNQELWVVSNDMRLPQAVAPEYQLARLRFSVFNGEAVIHDL